MLDSRSLGLLWWAVGAMAKKMAPAKTNVVVRAYADHRAVLPRAAVVIPTPASPSTWRS